MCLCMHARVDALTRRTTYVGVLASACTFARMLVYAVVCRRVRMRAYRCVRERA